MAGGIAGRQAVRDQRPGDPRGGHLARGGGLGLAQAVDDGDEVFALEAFRGRGARAARAAAAAGEQPGERPRRRAGEQSAAKRSALSGVFEVVLLTIGESATDAEGRAPCGIRADLGREQVDYEDQRGVRRDRRR